MAINQGSMRDDLDNVFQVLINDEELMRLLWYKPKRFTKVDPLDKSLPNVTEMNEYWDIVDERVLTVGKINDLEKKPICRLFITLGRRKPDNNNYYLAKQEIVISIFVHEEYEWDMRLGGISDRITKLLALKEVAGMGKFDYVDGRPYAAPLQYLQYVHVFEYSTAKTKDTNVYSNQELPSLKKERN